MEAYEPKKRRKYYQQKYAEHPAVYFASALFLIYQVARLIRIFTDAAAAKAANLATPASYSVGGVVGAVLTILLSLWIFLLLFRQRKGVSRLRSGRRYLVIDLLLMVYGVVRVVNRLIAVIDFFMVLYLLDLLAAAAALCVPAGALWWADRERVPPEDMLLLLCGAGAAGFSLLSVIILAISIGKDYTIVQVLPELALRAGVLLCGVAEVVAALKLRAEAPIIEPAEKPEKPEKIEKPKKPKRELHLKLFDHLPDFDDDPENVGSLFSDDDEDDDGAAVRFDAPDDPDAYSEPDDPDEFDEPDDAPERFAPSARAYVSDITPEQRRVPSRAYIPDDVPEQAAPPRESRQTSAPRRPGSGLESAGVRPARMPEGVRQPVRATCPDCGRRFPAVLGTCPYCGRFLGDD